MVGWLKNRRQRKYVNDQIEAINDPLRLLSFEVGAKMLLSSELGVACFEELFFTDGIATKGCYCCNAEANRIYGFDEGLSKIVSIDFADEMARRTYDIRDDVLREAKWHSMLYILTGNQESLLALLTTNEDRKDLILNFSLVDRQLRIIHQVVLDEGHSEYNEEIRLLQFSDTRKNLFIKLTYNCTTLDDLQRNRSHSFTNMSLLEIITGKDRSLILNNIFDQFPLGRCSFYPVAHDLRIYFYDPNSFESDAAGQVPMGLAMHCLPLDGSSKYYIDIFDHPGLNNDVHYFCPAMGSAKSELFYFAFNETANHNMLLGIDLNGDVVRRHLALTEHPVRTDLVLFSNDRVIINGLCTRDDCRKWHTYHFVLDNLCPFSLKEISAVLSPEKQLVYCGDASVQLILVWMIRQIIDRAFSSLTLYAVDEKARLTYTMALSALPLLLESWVKIVKLEPNTVPKSENSFMIVQLSEISYETRMSMVDEPQTCLVFMSKKVSAGLDHPRSVKWIGGEPETTEGSGATTINDTAATDALSLTYPSWKESFASDCNTTTILIPPCGDIDKSAVNAGVAGYDAERVVIERLTKLNIGGMLVTGLKGTQFLNAHCATHNKNFEIDALFIHEQYGIIVFECKAVNLESAVTSLVEQKPIKTAAEQLLNIGAALSGILNRLCEARWSECLIRKVILLPNSLVNDVEKVHFRKRNKNIALWDKDDLEESNLRAKFADAKADLLEAELFSDITAMFSQPPNNYLDSREMLQNFARTTACARSIAFISPKHNALAIHERLYFQRDLETPTPVGKLHHECVSQKQKVHVCYNGVRTQPIYLTRDQEAILKAENKVQIVSGPPGTGKTLLMLLKTIKLVKQEFFTGQIHVRTRSRGSVLECRQFIEDNLAHGHRVHVHYADRATLDLDSDAALFVDELSVGENLIEVLNERKDCQGPTFVCISGATLPGLLSCIAVEQCINRSENVNVRHTFLSTVYRGTKNVINHWRLIYGHNFSLKIGHSIRGCLVEERELVTYKDIMQSLMEDIRKISTLHSFDVCDGLICAVITDQSHLPEMVRSRLSASGIPCGTVLEHVKNPKLMAVDESHNCLSVEWPVVFYVEAGLGSFSQENHRFIAYSRALAKLVILKRNFMKIIDKFDRILHDNHIDLTKTSLREFFKLLHYAARKTYMAEFVEWIRVDFVTTLLRYDYWPTELNQCPSWKFETLVDGLAMLGENTDALLKFVNADGSSTKETFIIKNVTIREEENIPEYLKTVWSDQTPAIIKKRWRICRELSASITRLSDTITQCNTELEYDQLKCELGENVNVLGLIARLILPVVALSIQQ